MTLDGKIATASGDSKWITGKAARAEGMKLRQGTDAILVGVNTVLADDPALTRRSQESEVRSQKPVGLRRIILDSRARTPMTAKVVTDRLARWTTIVVTKAAPARRVAALAKQVNVWTAPAKSAPKESGGPGRVAKQVDLRWVIGRLGAENVTSLLVEGGGEVNAAFLAGGFAQRIAFFYAPKVLGGRAARKAVAGVGARRKSDALTLSEIEWHPAGDDFQITARVSGVRG
jgi:diaminohydroxyphosphoribosylaminopyrimidine deaminase/5-amino-6-(5-phosphoribosylamino)uracil reductase